MLKCPYCYEALDKEIDRCPHCNQFIIDELLKSDFPSVEKKKCIFCGKNVLQRAKICRHCHKWLDEVSDMVEGLDFDNLFED